MDLLDYREKLGIGFNDGEKERFFKKILFNSLDSLAKAETTRLQINEQEYFNFCNMVGVSTTYEALYGEGYTLVVRILHHHSDSLAELLFCYTAFLNCQEDDNKFKEYTRANFLNLICSRLQQAHIAYEVIEDKDGYFIFPKGVQEFDNALVSQPLQWLNKYPDAEKAWSKALREYSEATSANASDVADKFRKALETFFQEFFQSNKSLENLKSEYGAYLKAHGVPKEISGNLETLYQTYTNYMNNYAKHRDATSDKVLEYLMYQTGNIMRLLITLK